MCQVLALRSSVGLLREWGAGTVRARWQGAGRPGSGVVRAEGPGMKAAGDQMWKESPGTSEASAAVLFSSFQEPLRLVWTDNGGPPSP